MTQSDFELICKIKAELVQNQERIRTIVGSIADLEKERTEIVSRNSFLRSRIRAIVLPSGDPGWEI